MQQLPFIQIASFYILDFKMKIISYQRYLLISGFITIITALILIIAIWLISSLNCGIWGYKANWFLGYCSNPRYGDYGDYDHGAFFYQLESDAVTNAKRADVLIFGNSRALFAFPSEKSNHYFTNLGLNHFNLAFGHDERDLFPLKLIQKLELRPKLVIINADPMFSGTMSPVGLNLISSPFDVWIRYRAKWLLNKYHKQICITIDWICGSQIGPLGTFFRSKIDGGWSFFEEIPDEAGIVITKLKKHPIQISQENMVPFIKNAQNFIEAIGAEKKCIILTGIPNSLINSEEIAEQIAKELNLLAVIPRIDGLLTTDGSHFTTRSADRWRDAFFKELDSKLSFCFDKLSMLN